MIVVILKFTAQPCPRRDRRGVDLSRSLASRESRQIRVRANGGHAVALRPYRLAGQPITATGSMAVPSDDAMVNSTARAERLVGDECRICLKSCTEACQLFRDDRGIPEKLMAVAAVQVSSPPAPPPFLPLSLSVSSQSALF